MLAHEPSDTPEPASPTGVRLERDPGGDVTAYLRGQLKFDTVDSLLLAIRGECERAAPSKLLVDCADVDFIDSQALSLLLSLSRSCRQRGSEMEVHRPRPMVRKLLNITRLDTLITVVDSPSA